MADHPLEKWAKEKYGRIWCDCYGPVTEIRTHKDSNGISVLLVIDENDGLIIENFGEKEAECLRDALTQVLEAK